MIAYCFFFQCLISIMYYKIIYCIVIIFKSLVNILLIIKIIYINWNIESYFILIVFELQSFQNHDSLLSYYVISIRLFFKQILLDFWATQYSWQMKTHTIKKHLHLGFKLYFFNFNKIINKKYAILKFR